jgi:hypothetical protein
MAHFPYHFSIPESQNAQIAPKKAAAQHVKI